MKPNRQASSTRFRCSDYVAAPFYTAGLALYIMLGNWRFSPRFTLQLTESPTRMAGSLHQSEDGTMQRNTGIHTELITEPQDNLSSEKFLSHLMHVEAKDVTLKFAFDHVRNYIICGAILLAGLTTLKLRTAAPIHSVAFVLGGTTLALSAVLLFFLNFIHGITAFSKIRNFSKVSKAWYVVVTFLLLMGA